MSIILTPSQLLGSEQFREFMLNPNKRVASVSGAAGVGKSVFTDHCLGAMDSINSLGAYFNNRKISQRILTATTNKAAKVLKEMPNADPDQVSTIYSRLGLRLSRDYKTGKEFIAKGRNYASGSITDALLVMDEASYSTSRLVNYIFDSAPNSKILLVGDHCQLTSVEEPDFDVFDQPYIDSKIELLDPVRFDPLSPLGRLNERLRDWVMNQDLEMEIIPNGVDIIFATNKDINQHLHNAFVGNKYGDTRFIAYQNLTCVEINTYVRNMLGFPETPSVGEHMVVAKAFAPQNKNKIDHLYVDQELELLHVDADSYLFDGIRGHQVQTNRGNYIIPVDFKQYYDRIKYYRKESMWPEMYSLVDTFVDMRPDYARTAHKAQGSTHDTVIIDMDDLLEMKSRDQFIRALYVAVSRARQRVIIYNYPA